MPGLTAKVFRTYNASITLDDIVSSMQISVFLTYFVCQRHQEIDRHILSCCTYIVVFVCTGVECIPLSCPHSCVLSEIINVSDGITVEQRNKRWKSFWKTYRLSTSKQRGKICHSILKVFLFLHYHYSWHSKMLLVCSGCYNL
jgi:hypothetical protein